MADEPLHGNPGEPPDPEAASAGRPSLAGLVVVGALVLFGLVLFLANFSGQVADPGQGKPAADLFKDKDGKAKGKGKGKGRRPKPRPEEALWHHAVPAEQAPAPAGAKNLVIVTVAALRRDFTGPYGGPEGLTPRLTALAGGGARFADAITPSPFSRTAGIAAFTGQLAPKLDLVEPRPAPNERVVPDEVTWLAERLSDAGWQTYGVTANFNFNVEQGLAQGFHHYRDAQPMAFSLQQRIDGPDLVGHALAMLKGRSDADRTRPFYLQVAMVDPHQPLRTYDEEITALGDVPNKPYRAAVQRVDRSLGTLLDGLAELGHADDTLVVVLASHGEGMQLPEHHGKLHGRLLYGSSVEVPWVVAGPGVKPGHLVGGLASTVDLTPTVLELLGQPVPAGLDGLSWAAQVRGEASRTTRDKAISDTWYFQANRGSIWTEARQCQKDFGSLPLQDSFADGCYDRRTDPDFTNLIEDAALMAELEAWRASLEGVVTQPDPGSADDGGDDPAVDDDAPG